MTTMTPPPARNASENPDYFLGRADAYDDTRTRTLDELKALGAAAVDHATLPYAEGYMDVVIEAQLTHDVVTPLEIELAYTATEMAR
ncbi:hypothetical protein [Streptomyces sp. Da 82-17]|uniref:hypothetical protein n=1 Tax=Streptomyces sp. Da 82-17 TaxID=3377116 RepID=UPI0038D44DBC